MAGLPKVRYHLSELIWFYAEYGEGGHEFGPLHVVLADENLEDELIHYCYERAVEKGDVMAQFIAVELRGLSMEERRAVYRTHWAHHDMHYGVKR